MNKCIERLYNGVIRENPTFVQMLGMCPTLAVTSTAVNGLGMGLATTAVLTMSNLMISALRKVIPDKVRIPAFITIIASFVTIISFVMQAYTPELYDSLGVFISLIVVNCIILGRAEAYASKNPVLPSVFDGLGMGLGFTVGLTVIGIIREFLGAGTVFGFTVTSELWDPIKIFTSNPGAFFVLAFIVAGINAAAIRKAKKKGGKPKLRRIDSCAGCTNLACAGRQMAEDACVEEMKTVEATKKTTAEANKKATKDATKTSAAEAAKKAEAVNAANATKTSAAEAAKKAEAEAIKTAAADTAEEAGTGIAPEARRAEDDTPDEALKREKAKNLAARLKAMKQTTAMEEPETPEEPEEEPEGDTDDKLVIDESDEEVESILAKTPEGKKSTWTGTVTMDMETGEVTSDTQGTKPAANTGSGKKRSGSRNRKGKGGSKK